MTMESHNGQSGSPQQPDHDVWSRRRYVASECAAVHIEGRADAVRNRRRVLFMIGTSVGLTEAVNYGRWFGTNEQLARDAKLPISTVKRALAALREQGLIRFDMVRRRNSVTITRWIILDAKLMPEWREGLTYPKESGPAEISGPAKGLTYPKESGPAKGLTYPRKSGPATKEKKYIQTRDAHTDTRGHARTRTHEGDGSLEVPVPADESRQAEAVDAMVGNLASGMTTSPPRDTRLHAVQRHAQQRQPAAAPRYTDRLTDTYCYRKPQSAEDREANRAYMRQMGFGGGSDDGADEDATRKKAGRIADEAKRADVGTRKPGSRAAKLRAGFEAKFDATEGHVTVTAEEVEARVATLSNLSKKSEV